MEEKYITLAKKAAEREAEAFVESVYSRADKHQVDREWFMEETIKYLKKVIKKVDI